MPLPSRPRWPFLVPAGAILVLAMALRAWGLDAQSIWADEVYTALYARFALDEVLRFNVLAADPQPPLYYYVVNLLGRATGSLGEFTLRFPALFFGVASVAALLALGRRLLGDRVALFAGLFLAVSPYHLWFAQETRSYTQVTFFGLVSLLLFVTILQRPQQTPGGGRTPPWWLIGAWVVVTGAAIASHYYGAFLLLFQWVAFVGWWVMQRGVAIPWRRFLPAQLVFILPVLVAAPFVASRALEFRGENTFQLTWETVGTYLRLYLAGQFLEPELALPVTLFLGFLVVLGVAVLAVGTKVLPCDRNTLAFLAAWLLVPLVGLGVILVPTGRNLIEARYLIFLTPALYILAAAGLAWLSWRPRWLPAVAAVAVIGLGVTGIWPWHTDPAFAKVDIRGAVATLEAERAPGMLVVAPGDVVFQVYEYYLERRGAPATGLVNLNPRRTPLATAPGLLGDAREAWVIPYGRTEDDERVLSWFDGYGWLVETRPFSITRARQYLLPGPGTTAGPLAALPAGAERLSSPLQLVGVALDAAGPVPDGVAIPLRLAWALEPGVPLETYRLKLQVQTRSGVSEVERSLTDGLVLGTAAGGDPRVQAVSRLAVPVPVGTLPGEATVLLSVIDTRGTEVFWQDRAGAPAGFFAPVVQGAVVSRSQEPLVRPGGEDLGGGARLLAMTAPGAVPSGRTAQVAVEWQPAPDGPVALGWQLVAPDGAVVASGMGRSSAASGVPGSEPPLYPGRPVRDVLDVPTRDAPQDGQYRLEVRVGDAPARVLATLDLQGRPRTTAVPALDRRLDLAYVLPGGQAVELLGVTAPGVPASGGVLPVTLAWRARDEGRGRDATVFVQLLDGQGRVVAQSDREPAGGQAPTSTWVPGEVVTDRHELALRPGIAPGTYRIIAGFYDAASGARGQAPGSGSDFLELGAVRLD